MAQRRGGESGSTQRKLLITHVKGCYYLKANRNEQGQGYPTDPKQTTHTQSRTNENKYKR